MATYLNYQPHSQFNDFMSPNSVWDNIEPYLPRDKVIWEAFYGNGASGDYLTSLGLNVIHEPVDFFTHDLGDVVVSNPPFELKRKIIERLVELDKPFILLVPVSTICYQYAKVLKDNLQIMIPPKRINFIRWDRDTNDLIPGKSSATFDCLYLCFKMNLPQDIIYL